MDSVFIYWDNSNIFHEAQRLSEERNGGPDARRRVRIDFDKMFQLARAGRPLAKAVAAGSVPPELRYLWNRLESPEVEVKLFDRGTVGRGEQNMPDDWLQLQMLADGLDHNGDPGIVVLLNGDSAGYFDGAGFHSTLERMHSKGWRIEVLSWTHSCNKKMKQWVEEHGVFVPLDDFYEAITFMENAGLEYDFAPGRDSTPLDLSHRVVS